VLQEVLHDLGLQHLLQHPCNALQQIVQHLYNALTSQDEDRATPCNMRCNTLGQAATPLHIPRYGGVLQGPRDIGRYTMLCPTRKSTMTTSNGRTPRFPRNRKPGRCVECGAFLARGEGCLEIHGMKSVVYC
jgi:hypothetical protein